MAVKMKDSAKSIYDEWGAKYCAENDRLGGNSAEGDFVESWCIIENEDYVKTLDDVVGLMIFGYDDNALGIIDEWIATDGEDDTYLGFKLVDIKHELEKHFEW